MSTSTEAPPPDSVIPRQRSRRTKQVSSAAGGNMFNDEYASKAVYDGATLTKDATSSSTGTATNEAKCTTGSSNNNDSITLKDVALRLRRARRSLLLSAASMDRPVSPSESLRTIISYLSSAELLANAALLAHNNNVHASEMKVADVGSMSNNNDPTKNPSTFLSG